MLGRSYLCSGVTATFDVGGYPWTWDLRSWSDTSVAMPHVEAAGPLLSTRDHWLNLPAERQFMHIPTDSAVETAVDYLAANGTSAVKVWFLVGARSDTAALRARLGTAAAATRAAGLPLIVHATGLWDATVAVENGAHLLVHGVQDRPVDDRFLRAAAEAGTFYSPTLLVYDGYAQLAARRFDPGRYGDALACVDPASLGRARATDAGNPLTLHGPSVYPELEAMADAGLTPGEVLVAATRDAARAMGRADDLGTLEPGKVADLLVLTADPLADVRNWRRVESVMRGGRLHPRGELTYR